MWTLEPQGSCSRRKLYDDAVKARDEAAETLGTVYPSSVIVALLRGANGHSRLARKPYAVPRSILSEQGLKATERSAGRTDSMLWPNTSSAAPGPSPG